MRQTQKKEGNNTKMQHEAQCGRKGLVLQTC